MLMNKSNSFSKEPNLENSKEELGMEKDCNTRSKVGF